MSSRSSELVPNRQYVFSVSANTNETFRSRCNIDLLDIDSPRHPFRALLENITDKQQPAAAVSNVIQEEQTRWNTTLDFLLLKIIVGCWLRYTDDLISNAIYLKRKATRGV